MPAHHEATLGDDHPVGAGFGHGDIDGYRVRLFLSTNMEFSLIRIPGNISWRLPRIS